MVIRLREIPESGWRKKENGERALFGSTIDGVEYSGPFYFQAL
jgi:hypothetical protein